MQQRFVIVPALPMEKDVFQRKAQAWSGAPVARFDLYDNQEKQRLTLSLQSRPDAEAECFRRNGSG
ncbi:hypothetical protein [Pseudomonas cremoricolorata]|uniref:hypothetical protein n=1 Tax=Pseudomonas cremoricolorata TaxID=157783 RepID=UPI00040B2A11|nr:hypothetical protein [Pseudomonas cremoricolorata]